MSHLVDRVSQVFTHDVAIDLGTANTQVALRGVGIVMEEPSVVAINQRTQQVLAVGTEAKQMAGRTPGNVVAVRPLRDGVISDFDTTEAMIRYFIQELFQRYAKPYQLNKPRIVIGVPSLITEVESRAVVDAAKSAGARKVYLVEEPIAAAIGIGMPIEEAKASMVIDIGGGTTDIALISMGGMVIDNTIKIAGDEMDEIIMEYVRHKYNLLISENIAEQIKIEIGSAYKLTKEKETSIGGRDLLTGLPKSITISSIEIREALNRITQQIAEAAQQALEKAPPEMLNDLLQSGIYLVGGGAKLLNLDKFLTEKLKLKVQMAEEPTRAVVNGCFKLLDRISLLEKIQVKDTAFI